MRKFLFTYKGGRGLGTGIVLAFCLAVSMFSPRLVSAQAAHAAVSRRQRVHAVVHRSGRAPHRRRSARSVSIRRAGTAHPSRQLVEHRISSNRRRRGQGYHRISTATTPHDDHPSVAPARVQAVATSPAIESASPIEDAVATQGAAVSDTQPQLRVAALKSDDNGASAVGDINQHMLESSQNAQVFSISVPRYTPMPLRGSYQVLVHQNIVADVEGLNRIQDDAQLNAMVRSGSLVALPTNPGLTVDPRLPFNRRYCRPWTAQFLSDLARSHEHLFGDPLILTSAVRTVSFQRHLARYNGNAAPAFGDTASPHLTGQAIDIGKKGMSWHEIAWMRAVLGQLQRSGKLDVEEEFEQACFHISIYETYSPHSPMPARLVAATDMLAPAGPGIGRAAESVHPPVRTVTVSQHTRRYDHSYYVHHVRRVAVHHRRHHRRSMSLLATGLR